MHTWVSHMYSICIRKMLSWIMHSSLCCAAFNCELHKKLHQCSSCTCSLKLIMNMLGDNACNHQLHDRGYSLSCMHVCMLITWWHCACDPVNVIHIRSSISVVMASCVQLYIRACYSNIIPWEEWFFTLFHECAWTNLQKLHCMILQILH